MTVDGPPPDWMLDEVTSAGRENLDPAHVARYDDKEDAAAADELEFLLGHGLASSWAVIDLGAGTGQFSLAVAPWCAEVTAVDVSPVMVDRLRANVAESGLGNIDVVQAGFLTYKNGDEPADLVYTRWALHHLPDFWKVTALRHMRAMLRPGGILRLSDIVYSFDPGEAAERIEAWCATLPDAGSGGEWTRGDIEDHVREEHSTYTWLLEPMIERSGFVIEHTELSDDGFYASYLARAI